MEFPAGVGPVIPSHHSVGRGTVMRPYLGKVAPEARRALGVHWGAVEVRRPERLV
jgi:hypothetical protein